MRKWIADRLTALASLIYPEIEDAFTDTYIVVIEKGSSRQTYAVDADNEEYAARRVLGKNMSWKVSSIHLKEDAALFKLHHDKGRPDGDKTP